MRNPLHQIKNRRLRNWIASKLKDGQVIDYDQFGMLMQLDSPHVVSLIQRNGFSSDLEDYDWLADLATIIEISSTQRNPEHQQKVPGWARNDKVLTAIYKAGIFNKQHAFWIKKRHVKKGKILEPLEDIIPLVLIYEEKETQDLINLYRNDPDVTMIVSPDIHQYKTIKDLNDLITFLRPPQFEGDFDENVDVLGKVGEWKIFFPKTMKGSMMCDPNDETTWCTVRKSGGNLFLSYVADPNSDVTLYYIVSQDKQRRMNNKNSWFSIGYRDGEIELEGEDGSISVDGDNEGLTLEILEEKFAENDLDQIISILDKHHESIGGQHPAKKEMIAASQNIVLFRKATDSLTKTERLEFVRSMLSLSPSVSPAIWRRILTTNFLKPENKKSREYRRYLGFMLISVPNSKTPIPLDIYKSWFAKRYEFAKDKQYFTKRRRKKQKLSSMDKLTQVPLTPTQEDFENISLGNVPSSLRKFFMTDKDLQVTFAGRDDLSQDEIEYLLSVAPDNMAVLYYLVWSIPKQTIINEFLNTKVKVKSYPSPVLSTLLQGLFYGERSGLDGQNMVTKVFTMPQLADPKFAYEKLNALPTTLVESANPYIYDIALKEFSSRNRWTDRSYATVGIALSLWNRISPNDTSLDELETFETDFPVQATFYENLWYLIKDNPQKQKMLKKILQDTTILNPALYNPNWFMSLKTLQVPLLINKAPFNDWMIVDLKDKPIVLRAILDGPTEDRQTILTDLAVDFDYFTPGELKQIRKKIGSWETENFIVFPSHKLTRENVEKYAFLGKMILEQALLVHNSRDFPANENIEDGLPDWLMQTIANYSPKDKREEIERQELLEDTYFYLIDGSPWKYYVECENEKIAFYLKQQIKESRRRAKARKARRAARRDE